MSNTYILLKDLPDGSIVGDEYAKYGDQYRNERFRKDKCPVIEDAAWFTWQVENNPEWFKLKEQVEEKRIEVKEGRATYNDGFQAGIYWCKKYGIPDITPPRFF